MAMYAGHFDFTQRLVWAAEDLLSPEECREMLARVEGAEWLAATVNRAEGRAVDAKVRDNTVAVVRDEALAQQLWPRVRAAVPAVMMAEDDDGRRVAMAPRGLYVPLRVYRYETGQHFGLHEDQSYTTPDGDRSLLTFMVYLNGDVEGGETDFPELSLRFSPVAGRGLFFQHRVLHAGRRVLRGTKYVLRSDVVYRAVERPVL